ncbi:MAG TPA: hypothetical protein VNL98_11370 [Gemmatimonadales bacterium]|nr:hypothetical protein [Gemmatimonadales bacterium]
MIDIMARRCWIGQTREQLVDALGSPHAKDVKQTARSRRETWQYHGLKVTLEDEVVTSWQSHEERAR